MSEKSNISSGYHYITVKLFDDNSLLNNKGKWEHELKKILDEFQGVIFRKLFTSLCDEAVVKLLMKAKETDHLYKPVNLFSFYFLLCPENINSGLLVESLLCSELVELAYLNGRTTTSPSSIKQNNSLVSNYHLETAPYGIDAKYAWKHLQTKGEKSIKFIDIEQGWHEDDEYVRIRTLPLTGINNEAFRDHGTAVFGIIATNENSNRGGIFPGAEGYIISQWRPDGLPNEADAILAAISYLNFGDVLLIESQSFHHDTGNKLWPVEIHDAVFEVIRLATALGIIVIEPAGNGRLYLPAGNDLDLFSNAGKKILNPSSDDFRDSGAIMVAAATWNNCYHKAPHSNYGERINCFASGESTGPGEVKVNGTSAASAIIAGAAIVIQTFYEATCNERLSPAQMRQMLSNRKFGTCSVNAGNVDKIGVMPDLKKILNAH
ncbi:MAG: S8 family serine peptidase [Chitinophagaceae bacterium]